MKKFKASYVRTYRNGNGNWVSVYQLPKSAIPHLEDAGVIYREDENGNPIVFSTKRFINNTVDYVINGENAYFIDPLASLDAFAGNDEALKSALKAKVADQLVSSVFGNIAAASTPVETPAEEEASKGEDTID